MKYLLRVPPALVLAGFALWAFGALWFQAPFPEPARLALAAGVAGLFSAGAIGVLLGHVRRVLLPLAVLALGILIWWATVKPSDTRDWTADAAQKARISRNGDVITVKNVRNFIWSSAETPAQERWETRQYSLSRLKTLDLFLSTWGNPDIAHTLLSFGFDDGRHLVFSVEIRKERGEAFDSLAGFFRKYELMISVADEADIIKVRANQRDEQVSRYRIDVKPENAARLFLKYAALVQRLDEAPEFYNTLTTNCTTAIYSMLRELDAKEFPLDRRVLISGRVPEYLYDLGYIARDLPFETLKQSANITARSKAAEGAADYSAAIRR